MYGPPLKWLGVGLGAIALIVAATVWLNGKFDTAFDNGVQRENKRVRTS